MITTTTIVVLSILLVICIYIIINLYNKNNLLLIELGKADQLEQSSIDLVESLLLTYIQVLAKLSRVDKRGSFESDDEVGFVFKTIKSTIEELKESLIELKKQISEPVDDGNI